MLLQENKQSKLTSRIFFSAHVYHTILDKDPTRLGAVALMVILAGARDVVDTANIAEGNTVRMRLVSSSHDAGIIIHAQKVADGVIAKTSHRFVTG